MSTPVVLITGGLTGIGRAAAFAFARKGATVVVAGRRDEAGKASPRNCILSVQRPSSSIPTFGTKMTSVPWWIKPSHALAVSMSR
jgi:NAD(P)-dependent dehydrogenase (short-subunit alcohol dehydrogenase family)